MRNKVFGFLLGIALVAGIAGAQDWYEATGRPVQRSQLNSADFRTEFASIDTNIADKLPPLAGNGGNIVVVNAGGTALTVASGGLGISVGGTGATTAAGARTSLGLAIGTDVQAFDAGLSALSGLNTTDSNFIVGNGAGWIVETGSVARTSLGLGSIATLSTINGGNWSGTDLSVANGGTGSSTSSGARTNLGLTIGANVQAFDTDLSAIAGLADTNGNFIVGNGSTWVAESGATARASLSLGSLATLTTISNNNWSGTDLSVANGGTGSSTTSGARTNLGLGSLATLNSINANNWSGTDLSVAQGGTGSSTASGARTNLGLGTSSFPHFGGVNIGNSVDTTITRQSAGSIDIAGRAVITHNNTAYASGRIVVTATTPTDTTGMSTGDIRLVY